ncbi:MAG TPA: transporter substrate-binding domain-containing protein [Syntrophorhabdaceae bacterium]|jgi:polar amino acid transport system substrate-binding protein
MNRKGRMRLYMAATAALMLFTSLMGCHSDNDKSLEKIKQAGVIRIASGPGYPPFTYRNAKGELAGFDVALSGELAKRLGVKAEIVTVQWEDIINGLKGNKYDAILGSMSVTEERAKVVDFSLPYYYARSQVMVPKDSTLKSVKDLKNKSVGVMGETTFEDDAKAQGITQLRRYKTNDDAVVALGKKEVDAIITDDVAGMYAKNRLHVDIEPFGDTLSTDKISIAVRKGDRTLLKKIDAVIEEMQKDGTLRDLVERMASNRLDSLQTK